MFDDMVGGEIYVKKIHMKVTDIARVIAPEAKHRRYSPGEKLHEQMIGAEDSYFTYEYPEHCLTANQWLGRRRKTH